MKKKRIFFFTAVFTLLIPCASSALQTGADSSIVQVEQLYENGSFVSAELEARRALEAEGISDSLRTQLDKYIAFSLVAQGKNKGAVERFLIILKRSPEFDLDPVFTAPKILQSFYEAKNQFTLVKKEKPTPAPVEGDRIGKIAERISFRALVFPGWEQLHQGRRTTGYLFLTAGTAAAGAAAVSAVMKNSARSSYLSASTSADAEKRYDRYNSLNKVMIYSLSAFAVSYLLSQADVILTSAGSGDKMQAGGNIPLSNAVSLIRLSFPLPR